MRGKNDGETAASLVTERRHWMGVLAKSPPEALEAAWNALNDRPVYAFLRAPETGLAMVSARAGGNGIRFNLGEMTLTRCVVRLHNGGSGYGHVAGRNPRHAELAAVFDALLQDPHWYSRLHAEVIAPLAQALEERKRVRAAKAAATQVDFFTLVRGGD